MNDDTLLKQVLDLLDAPPNAYGNFCLYHRLLIEWNRRVNLISKNDESKIIRRHFIDSLTLLKAVDFFQNIRVLDLGTGAGFPGIPIRLVRPDVDLVLLESKRKKGLFLKQLLLELNLSSEIQVVIGRAESCVSLVDSVDLVCSRAVADAPTLIVWSAPYLKNSVGRIIALKSPDTESELKSIPQTVHHHTVHQAMITQFEPFPKLMANTHYHVLDVLFK